MKYRAIIMAPQIVEFENSGNDKNIGNHAWGLCNNFNSVVTKEDTFVPRLLLVIPEVLAKPAPIQVFDPPPMAA